ncbi:hypothetical protein ACHHYP_20691 [Achlya hypogyna]|uniref:Uncharacterized protein n=1 Tax=Achlya hypogyna TaxID=1202772 RepID=A0A1V9YET7_ACHHY|nr:hypothetical protein ACHHYP_20691 [Achlya hypogyna]
MAAFCHASTVTPTVLVLPVQSQPIAIVADNVPNAPTLPVCLRRYHEDIVVREVYGDAMGARQWDAGIALATYLLSSGLLAHSPPQHVLELASGTGLLGIVVAKSLPASASIVLTERPSSLPYLTTTVAENHRSTNGAVHVLPLSWGDEDQQQAIHALMPRVDMLLLADVLYCWESHPALLCSIAALSQTSTRILLAHTHRSARVTAFVQLLLAGQLPNWRYRGTSLATLGHTEIIELTCNEP